MKSERTCGGIGKKKYIYIFKCITNVSLPLALKKEFYTYKFLSLMYNFIITN